MGIYQELLATWSLPLGLLVDWIYHESFRLQMWKMKRFIRLGTSVRSQTTPSLIPWQELSLSCPEVIFLEARKWMGLSTYLAQFAAEEKASRKPIVHIRFRDYLHNRRNHDNQCTIPQQYLSSYTIHDDARGFNSDEKSNELHAAVVVKSICNQMNYPTRLSIISILLNRLKICILPNHSNTERPISHLNRALYLLFKASHEVTKSNQKENREAWEEGTVVILEDYFDLVRDVRLAQVGGLNLFRNNANYFGNLIDSQQFRLIIASTSTSMIRMFDKYHWYSFMYRNCSQLKCTENTDALKRILSVKGKEL